MTSLYWQPDFPSWGELLSDSLHTVTSRLIIVGRAEKKWRNQKRWERQLYCIKQQSVSRVTSLLYISPVVAKECNLIVCSVGVTAHICHNFTPITCDSFNCILEYSYQKLHVISSQCCVSLFAFSGKTLNEWRFERFLNFLMKIWCRIAAIIYAVSAELKRMIYSALGTGFCKYMRIKQSFANNKSHRSILCFG